MTSPEVQAWLGALQARFSEVLRRPLTVTSFGTLQSDPTQYPAHTLADVLPSAKLSAAQRLSVYQTQYWMRLLRTLQEQYPLTTHLCGAWELNRYGMAFLTQHPPRQRDLGCIGDGFASYLEAQLLHAPESRDGAARVPSEAWLEAARIDAAYRRVFVAPPQVSWRLGPDDVVEPTASRLRISAALAIVREHWPLLQLRTATLGRPDAPDTLPARQAQPQAWVLHRTALGVMHARLDPDDARLLELLAERTLGEALAILERETLDKQTLPARVHRFLSQAMRANFFTGLS